MTLVDTVKRLGKAAEDGDITPAQAAAQLQLEEDGITAEGAADLIATWREVPRKP